MRHVTCAFRKAGADGAHPAGDVDQYPCTPAMMWISTHTPAMPGLRCGIIHGGTACLPMHPSYTAACHLLRAGPCVRSCYATLPCTQLHAQRLQARMAAAVLQPQRRQRGDG